MYSLPIYPIWIDYPIAIQTSEPSVDYTIQLEDGTTIYTGRAFKLPGADNVRIIPNEVCAPYVAVTGTPPLNGTTPIDGMTRTFLVAASTGTTRTITFAADYSYITADKWTYYPLLPPAAISVTGEVARDQVLAGALYVAHAGVTSCRLEAWDDTRKIAQWYIEATDAGILNFTKDLSELPYPSLTEMRVECDPDTTLRYKIVDTCARYILYYVNAFGSWASMIVDGMVKQTDEYTRTTYKRSYDTSYGTIRKNVQPRGTVDIQNDITRKYSLVTGWLTDKQSARMHHLLGSTNVYLYDRQGSGWDNGPTVGEYFPVVLTSSSCEYKTFRNQGAHLVNYTIEATAAQNYTRR